MPDHITDAEIAATRERWESAKAVTFGNSKWWHSDEQFEKLLRLAERQQAELADLKRQLDNDQQRAERAERLLCNLTIGGSEFAGNPEACARWIRNEIDGSLQAAIDANVRRQAAEGQVEAMRGYASIADICLAKLRESLEGATQSVRDVLAAEGDEPTEAKTILAADANLTVMREVLGWYADEGNYRAREIGWGNEVALAPAPTQLDRGDRARAALAPDAGTAHAAAEAEPTVRNGLIIDVEGW